MTRRPDPVKISQSEIARLWRQRQPGETVAQLAAAEYEAAHPEHRVTGATSGMSGFFLLVRDAHPGEENIHG